MLPDIDIARQARMQPIARLAEELGILPEELFNYGEYKAKLNASAIQKRLRDKPQGKLVLLQPPIRHRRGKEKPPPRSAWGRR